MKFLGLVLFVLAGVGNTAVAAGGNLVVNTNTGAKVVIELLGNELDESEVYLLREMGGQDAVFMGDLCYTGSQNDAKKILKLLSDMDFLGDEFHLIGIRSVSGKGIEYKVYDGPNQEAVQKVTFYPCP